MRHFGCSRDKWDSRYFTAGIRIRTEDYANPGPGSENAIQFMPILTNVRENEWKRETEGENGKKREIFLKFFGALVAKGFAHLTAEPAVSSSNPAVTPRNSRVLKLTINFCDFVCCRECVRKYREQANVEHHWVRRKQMKVGWRVWLLPCFFIFNNYYFFISLNWIVFPRDHKFGLFICLFLQGKCNFCNKHFQSKLGPKFGNSNVGFNCSWCKVGATPTWASTAPGVR